MHKEIIMCAANRYWVKKPDGEEVNIVIADSGHFMPNMQAIIKLLKDLGCELTPDKSDGDRGQGFIGAASKYYSRSEAYKIVKESGQPFNDEYTLPHDKLDSSCIRHFPEDCDLKDYMK
ncbi:hypothetical protein [Vibrio phage JSF13]|jgi:hypothetical protein|uniref:Uncharacterized protein ORF111 n=2 Tax=root TaxID=1 RepID=F1D1D3_9CAUD|nr:hypothetical protein ViPhICP1_gp111 [Vibrio phage ICP1]ADX88157.1 hypothetical protein TUST1-191_00555 [Vibrio phage ICP1_2006_D]ADX88384.1 hypothetical protein TUST1-182_00555 [Vibrio phage ICP1_2006_C]ADX88611.1 hypothetical protein TUST1-159_00555 [Vibrio phage ICP1_2006_B]ADX88837.1 hypothetical protein TUST1-17_00555 [Vibrio phage ICP1_2006_A]ADX89068.1 hypothetical protein TUST1-15_00580 [Vibrio phage ICP1_2005_A]ADX89294.1 hypothetical protein TUST1-2_00560 [Vibrio phage ICP1_2001_A